MKIEQFKTMFKSAAGVKTAKDVEFNTQISVLAFLLASVKLLFLDNIYSYIAITTVVLLDCFFGMIRAYKQQKFETNQALKVVYYLPVYYAIITVVILIEKAQPSAFWLSETIIMPILVFQLISMLKNISEAELIKSPLIKKILENIDNYKSTSNINSK